MTAIAQAMKKAGVDTDAALLRNIAEDCLRKRGCFPRRALAPFVSEVRDAGGIMAALISLADTELHAIEYLERVAADMRGDNLKNSPPRETAIGDGKGQASYASDGQSSVALPANSAQADGGGQISSAVDGQHGCALSNNSSQGEAGGQHRSASDGHMRLAPGANSAVPRGEAGTMMPAIASRSVPSPGMPRNSVPPGEAALRPPARAIPTAPSGGKPRGMEALLAIRKVTSIFDTYCLSDGTKVGDLRYSQLDRVFEKSARDAAIVWVIRNAGVPADRNMRVRDYITPETISAARIAEVERKIEGAPGAQPC